MKRAGQTMTFVAVTLATVLVLAGALALVNLGIWYRAQHGLEDRVQSATAGDEPDPRVVIVAIDDASLARQRRQWPWPRELLARLVDRISGGRPQVLGIDILLTTPVASDAEGDAALAAAIATAERVVLLEKLAFSPGATGEAQVILPFAQLRGHAATGYFNLSLDSDHVFRRQRLQQEVRGETRVAFAYQLFLQWHGPKKRTPRPVDGVMRVSFRGPPETFLRVAANDVLSGHIPAATFKGRAVLIGATFTDAKDVYPTPVGSATPDSFMHGVEIHANILSSLLDGRQLQAMSPRASHLACLAIIAAVALMTALRTRRAGLSVVVVVLLAAGILFWALFRAGTIVPVVPLAVASLLGFGMGHVVRGRIHSNERRRMRSVLKLVVPPTVDQAALPKAGQAAKQQPLTLCIIDVDRFSEVAESLVRRDLGRYLHAYFAGVTTIVERHGGVLAEDLSVGIVAVFGIDARQVDHTARACRAALDLITTVGQMEQQWQREVGITLSSRIGVHTGQVSIAARPGAGRELTIVGRELYLATRLARLSKQYGCTILVSEESARVLSDHFRLQDLGEIRLRDRKGPTRIFSVQAEVAFDQTMVQSS